MGKNQMVGPELLVSRRVLRSHQSAPDTFPCSLLQVLENTQPRVNLAALTHFTLTVLLTSLLILRIQASPVVVWLSVITLCLVGTAAIKRLDAATYFH
ncbi:Hypothetical predicted protein [Cloeon dipterum]|uniref:Uncharacterized protein n=1 Tax=Cloeon dipterum TaxID=197152 RepID=A0A8S1DIF2_9INSE|nr:Hypothetical predicted protein [Cloeon dipterum]